MNSQTKNRKNGVVLLEVEQEREKQWDDRSMTRHGGRPVGVVERGQAEGGLVRRTEEPCRRGKQNG